MPEPLTITLGTYRDEAVLDCHRFIDRIAMNGDDQEYRERAIIARANYFSQGSHLPWYDFHRGWFEESVSRARINPRARVLTPLCLSNMPSASMLSYAFPDPDVDCVDPRLALIEVESAQERSRRRRNVSFYAALQEVSQALRDNRTLIRRLNQALHKMCHLQVNKIIGFGLGRVVDDSLANGLYTAAEPLGSLVRHAVLMICRQLLIHKGCASTATEIYVQDSRYREEDREMLEEHGITVLCAGHGQHQGLAEVDADTLVYIYDGFLDKVPIFSLITEICAPAGIMKAEPMYDDEREQFGDREGGETVWSVRVQSPITGIEVDVPQPGLRGNPQVLYHRYGWDNIQILDLEMANPGGRWQGPDFWPTINGWEHCHLGVYPVLYYRKHGVSGDLNGETGLGEVGQGNDATRVDVEAVSNT